MSSKILPLLVALTAFGASAAKETCTECHGALDPARLRDPAKAMRKDVHTDAGLSCVSCHGGVSEAIDAKVAHGAGFVGKPKNSDETHAMCGKCHQKPAENYLKGPHNLARDHAKRPNCATCHGAHGIQTASLEMIDKPLCTQCHTYDQAGRIQKAMFDAENELTDVLGQAQTDAGRKKLLDARSSLRGLMHSLDLMAVTRNATDALAVADEVRAKELPKTSARQFGATVRWTAIIIAIALGLLGFGFATRAAWQLRHKLPVVKHWKPVLVVLGVLGAGAAVAAYKGQHYIEHDPKFCTNCHNMNSAYGKWKESGHKEVECHACHIPNTINNIKQLVMYTTERPEGVDSHADIDRTICLKCHGSGASASKFTKVMETPGHRVHADKQHIECIQCHSTSVHRFKPPENLCAGCHKQITMTAAGTMAEMHCMECHPFMDKSATRPLKPDRALCLDCHQKRQIKGETFPAKAPMAWECGKCHKPHEKIRIANADCVKCHDSINEGLHQVKAHVENCQACHKPHGWSSGSTTCQTCHSTINPTMHAKGQDCLKCHGPWNDTWVALRTKH